MQSVLQLSGTFLASLLCQTLSQRLKKDFYQPFLLVAMNEDTIPSTGLRWSESSFAACGAVKSLKDLCFFYWFIIFSRHCLSSCGTVIEGTEWLIEQGALEAEMVSITGGLMLPLALPLLTNNVCHAAMQYEHLTSWWQNVSLLFSLLLRALRTD